MFVGRDVKIHVLKSGKQSILTSDGFGHDLVNSRKFLIDCEMKMKVRVIMDRFSVELFFNDGKQTASMILYTPQDCDGISFEAEGNVLMDIEKYGLALDEG